MSASRTRLKTTCPDHLMERVADAVAASPYVMGVPTQQIDAATPVEPDGWTVATVDSEGEGVPGISFWVQTKSAAERSDS